LACCLVAPLSYSADYGALFAGMVLAMIPSMLVYVLLQRSFTRGLVAGAVK
jgi:ABC-type glycerol-3-phosphate transport system permease component